VQSFKLKFLGVTILQGVEFPIFLLISEWALQHHRQRMTVKKINVAECNKQ